MEILALNRQHSDVSNMNKCDWYKNRHLLRTQQLKLMKSIRRCPFHNWIFYGCLSREYVYKQNFEVSTIRLEKKLFVINFVKLFTQFQHRVYLSILWCYFFSKIHVFLYTLMWTSSCDQELSYTDIRLICIV